MIFSTALCAKELMAYRYYLNGSLYLRAIDETGNEVLNIDGDDITNYSVFEDKLITHDRFRTLKVINYYGYEIINQVGVNQYTITRDAISMLMMNGSAKVIKMNLDGSTTQVIGSNFASGVRASKNFAVVRDARQGQVTVKTLKSQKLLNTEINIKYLQMDYQDISDDVDKMIERLSIVKSRPENKRRDKRIVKLTAKLLELTNLKTKTYFELNELYESRDQTAAQSYPEVVECTKNLTMRNDSVQLSDNFVVLKDISGYYTVVNKYGECIYENVSWIKNTVVSDEYLAITDDTGFVDIYDQEGDESINLEKQITNVKLTNSFAMYDNLNSLNFITKDGDTESITYNQIVDKPVVINDTLVIPTASNSLEIYNKGKFYQRIANYTGFKISNNNVAVLLGPANATVLDIPNKEQKMYSIFNTNDYKISDKFFATRENVSNTLKLYHLETGEITLTPSILVNDFALSVYPDSRKWLKF